MWQLRHIERNRLITPYLCYYRSIQNYGVTVAFVETAIPLETLKTFLPQQTPEGTILAFIADMGVGEIIISEVGGESDISLNLTGEYIKIIKDVPAINRQICCFVSTAHIDQVLRPNKLLFAIIALFISMAFFGSIEIVAFFFTRKITDMIHKMSGEINDIINQDINMQNETNDDFQQINLQMHELIKQTKEASDKTRRYEDEKNRLELELLQMRFNPHFLYNTLGTIRAIVKDNKYIKKEANNGRRKRFTRNKAADTLGRIQLFFRLLRFTAI